MSRQSAIRTAAAKIASIGRGSERSPPIMDRPLGDGGISAKRERRRRRWAGKFALWRYPPKRPEGWPRGRLHGCPEGRPAVVEDRHQRFGARSPSLTALALEDREVGMPRVVVAPQEIAPPSTSCLD